MEKPNPEIFWMACKELGVSPAQALHVGDHKTNDIVGASAAGCDSLLWGEEVLSFAEVKRCLYHITIISCSFLGLTPPLIGYQVAKKLGVEVQ